MGHVCLSLSPAGDRTGVKKPECRTRCC